MVDAVRALTLGSQAQVELGHPASYYVARALIWAAAILAVCRTARRRAVPARLTEHYEPKGASP